MLISPDGVLGRLPFGALPGKEPGKYLIEEYALAVVPVPQIIPELVQEAGRKQLRKNLLLMGNINYDVRPSKTPSDSLGKPEPLGRQPLQKRSGLGPFGQLSGTADEIAALKNMYRKDFGSDGVTTLDESHASKQAFCDEAPKHRYLHVATHGFFSPQSQQSIAPTVLESSRFGEMSLGMGIGGLHPGLQSGLALAGANRAQRVASLADPNADDGILTAEEIGAMNLDGADLVMLSACETGLGTAAGGEGLLGLQRAFQSAGTRTVVASLWKVDDRATQVLMVNFYRNLWDKKLGMLDALRQAQLTMLHQYRPKEGKLRGIVHGQSPQAESTGPLSPYYWAAFILSGNWR